VIERISDMPAGTLGFRVDGEIEREDYTEVLEPAPQAALDAGGVCESAIVTDIEWMARATRLFA
jgi:hypothetical protein